MNKTKTFAAKKLSDFQPGDYIQNKTTGNIYIVLGNYGSFAVAVREVAVMNPSEWEITRQIENKE